MSLIVKEEPKTSKATNATQDCFFDIVVRHSWHPEVELPVENGDLLVFLVIKYIRRIRTQQTKIGLALLIIYFLPKSIMRKISLAHRFRTIVNKYTLIEFITIYG